MNKILLVDGNSILNRAFYGLPDLTNSDGIHTNAVLGFLNIIQKVIDEEKPTNVCVAFDLKKPTFRHEMYKEYKGTRKPMPEELREQLPIMKDVLTAMNVKIVEMAGFEADDILGTMSRIGDAAGYEVVILSGDRDLLQLATDKILVRIPKTKAGKTIVENYYAADVEEAYGVDPEKFIELKALMGDTSDNIPGVPGIGEKTASKLLIEYGTLDGIYDAVPDMKPGKIKSNLEENKDKAYLSKVLATIKLDVPIDINLEDTIYDNPYNPESYKIFKKLEFKSLLNRFSEEDKLGMSSESGNNIWDADNLSIVNLSDKSELDALIQSVEAECGNKDITLGYDFVSGENGYMLCSFYFGGNEAYVAGFMSDISVDYITDKLSELAKKKVCLVTLDIKACLNAFDTENAPVNQLDNMYDCSVAAYLLNPLSGSYDYNDLARQYMGVILPDKKELVGKQTIDMFASMNTNICRYAAYRAAVSSMVWDKLRSELEEKEMWTLYTDIEMPCIYVLHSMEKYGIKVDRDSLVAYGEKLKARIAELTSEIYRYANQEFNINSPKQLGVILFEEMGLKHGKKTKTGYSTSVEVLEKISDEHPIIPLILEYRQLTKLDSTYVEGLGACISDDGRIHSRFNQTVTATGRISSTEPNLQNIPTRYPLGKEIRRVFVPEEGYVFLDADYSQIELRVLAHMSGDKTLINAYNQDTDIHSITASEVFGLPLEQVDELMRRKAKAVNFGIVYGISSFGLGQDLDISRKEAEGYIEKYFETYKDVKAYLDNTIKYAKDKGYSITMYGRRRPIPELKASNFMTRSFGERVAMNSPIQGTAADIIKLAMVNVCKSLSEKGYKSRLVLQVHDELIIETYKQEFDEVKEILVNEMVNAVKLMVPLIVDVHSGNNWLEAK